MTFGQKFAHARGMKGWSQLKLGQKIVEKMGEKEASNDSLKMRVSRIEKDKTRELTPFLLIGCEILEIPSPDEQPTLYSELERKFNGVDFKPIFEKMFKHKFISIRDIMRVLEIKNEKST